MNGRVKTDAPASDEPPFAVQSGDDLRELLARIERGRIPRRATSTIPGPDGASPSEARERLNRLLGECGCEQGAVGGMLGLASFAAAVLTGALPTSLGSWALTGLGVSVFVAGSGGGKLIGLYRARRALRDFLERWSEDVA